MHLIDTHKLTALEQLLSLPDEPPMAGKRTHKLTMPGIPWRQEWAKLELALSGNLVGYYSFGVPMVMRRQG